MTLSRAAALGLFLLLAHGCARPAPAPVTLSPAATAGASSGGAAPRFRFADVAAAAGITRVVLSGRTTMDHLLDSAGTGAAFLDYDRDGKLDVYVVNAWRLEGDLVKERGRNALYRNRGDGTFEDVTEKAGVGGEGRWGAGATVADYDGDGWPDILVTNFGANVLYRNHGDGTFSNVAAEVGIEAPGWNTGAAFLDADGDGDLDLYIAGYIDTTIEEVLAATRSLPWHGMALVAAGPFGLKGAPDHYFRSEGGKRFVEATEEAGLTDRALAYGFAVRAADFDGDGDPDIYVANDSDANYLYRNDGHGHFDEVGVWSGCALDAAGAAQASMGVAAADYDGDGVIDIFATNFSEDTCTLYHGLGGGLFDDVSVPAGIAAATFLPLSWGAAMADFDNDGDLDIVIANGHIYPQIDSHPEIVGTFAQRNMLLENDGGVFRDVTGSAGPGFQIVQSSRGLALGDYDNDGDLDILITNLNEPPSLLRNESAGGSWLTVAPEVEPGRGPLIGTKVTLTAGGRTFVGDVAAGDSYVSTHDPRVHFGLGKIESVDTVDVRWPDGTHTIHHAVSARQFLVIRKGS